MTVLIVGGGPTGLMMAAELARHQIPCRLIDHRLEASPDASRAVAIQARTLEIFDHVGIVDRFLQEGLPIQAANVMNPYKRPIARIPLHTIPSPFPFVLSIEQEKTERILRERAQELGVVIDRNVSLTHLEQREKTVEARLSSGKALFASWVIGCDGAHSFVRKALGIHFEGAPFPEPFFLADLHLDWDYPHEELCLFLTKTGLVAAIPLPEPDRYRLIFTRSPSSPHEPTLEEIAHLLKGIGRPYDPVWMAGFHVHSRLASTYRDRRVFLAGDAAHIHSPVGGQGMNTGIQDAYNLAWKIAHVEQRAANPLLLDSYEAERRFVGKTLLAATWRASRFLFPRHSAIRWVRDRLMGLAGRSPSLMRRAATLLSQTAICYPPSSVIRDLLPSSAGPRPGMRAPNIPLIIDGVPTDLYAIRRLSTGFQTLAFDAPGPPGSLLVDRTTDPTGAARALYCVTTPSLYTIRPDGYIASRMPAAG